MKKYIIGCVVLFNLLISQMSMADAFIVRNIELEGLQRVSKETVYSYLPIKKGQMLSSEKTTSIITTLYNTGFFDHISLARSGNTLIIKLDERPTIGQLKISGNSVIHTDKLLNVMKSVNIAEGRVYNSVILEKIKQSLLNQYYQLGRYNARVNVTVTPMDRNKVLVKIDISEGLVAKVRRINIIGNHAVTTKALGKQLELTTPGLLTYFTETDRFSQEKLDASLEKLRNYYLDRGYLKVEVKSTQVSITPDRKSIYLTVVIDEGDLYKVKGFTITGNTIIPKAELMNKIPIKEGDTFSRDAVIRGEKNITELLGDKGYVFAVISMDLKIDDKTKEVFLIFRVSQGKRAYVNHINFSDNAKTNDVVLRREVLQMESAVVSSSKLEESKRRIGLLPFIRDVKMSYAPVEENSEDIDVNYKVVEDDASAQANLSIGYSQLDHFIFSAGLNQKNFLGTGKTLGLNFSNSRYQTFVGINYTDPYYSPDGISRSISLTGSKFDPRAANISSSYTFDQYNLSVVYGIPIAYEKGANNRVQLGYGYENILIDPINSPRNPISNQVNDFINQYGTHFQQITAIFGISRDARNRAIFPTKGSINTVGLNLYLPVSNKSLKYYTLSYTGRWYHPIAYDFVASARGNLGYGTAFSGPENYPFFKNFYAGGIDSVPGYTGNTLGPKDNNKNPTGGNFLATAGAGIIFPNYISDNLRTSLFLDAGNVYNTFSASKFGGTDSGPVRYSMGIEADWITLFGPIEVSVAKTLNAQPGDNKQTFQLSLGANFG